MLEYETKLEMTSLHNWRAFSDYYYNIISRDSGSAQAVSELISDVLPGSRQRQDLEKAKVIYQYIDDNYHNAKGSSIYPYVPQKVKRTIQEKGGTALDLCVLYVAMLKAAGMQADVVYVKENVADKRESTLFSDFGHYITRLSVAGNIYYIDPTRYGLPFLALSDKVSGSRGLVITNDTLLNNSLVEISSAARKPNEMIIHTEVALHDTNADVNRTISRTGAMAAAYRADAYKYSDSEKYKRSAGLIVKDFDGRATVISQQLVNFSNLADTLAQRSAFTVAGFLKIKEDSVSVTLPWFDKRYIWSMCDPESRITSFNSSGLTFCDMYEETIEVVPPGKMKCVQPDNIVISNELLTYTLTFAIEQNKLVARRSVKFLKGKITPQDYSLFRASILKVRSADRQKIILSWSR